MQFYPADWMNDTMILSAEARGCWINLLCLMWNAPKRGEWTGTFEEFGRVTGTPWEHAPRLINELAKVATVTKRDIEVTLHNRRMLREDLDYKDHANRQKRYRALHKSDAIVTRKTLDSKTLDSIKERYIERKFTKPTAEELTAYGASIGYTLEAQKFLAHYESNGWRVGKNPMKDWKATVRTWRANAGVFSGSAPLSVKAAVLPTYKESVPPADEIMSGDDFAKIKIAVAQG